MPEATECIVCGEVAAPEMTAQCNWCGGTYHLNQRNDIEAKDCGQVWVDEQFMALQFACNACLAGDGPKASPAGSARPGAGGEPSSGRQRRYKRRA